MDDDYQYTEAELEDAVYEAQKAFVDLIGRKCRDHCGMTRAWTDGLCHATEQMCCLVPHNPIWAGKASQSLTVMEAESLVFEDL